MNKQHWWIITKIASVVLTSIATYNVFHAAFKKSITSSIFFIPRNTAILLGVAVAFVLVDLLFVMLVTFLEEARRPGEVFSARWGQVVSLWVLYLFIVAIGFVDEGIIAFAPRIGLGILALNATLTYISEWRSWMDETWEDRFNKKRNRKAQLDHLDMTEYERAIKRDASKKALYEVQPELIDDYYNQYVATLLNRPTAISEPKLIIAGEIVPESIDQASYVYRDSSGRWVWEDPYTGELHTRTAIGNDYTESGARRALGRFLAK